MTAFCTDAGIRWKSTLMFRGYSLKKDDFKINFNLQRQMGDKKTKDWWLKLFGVDSPEEKTLMFWCHRVEGPPENWFFN